MASLHKYGRHYTTSTLPRSATKSRQDKHLRKPDDLSQLVPDMVAPRAADKPYVGIDQPAHKPHARSHAFASIPRTRFKQMQVNRRTREHYGRPLYGLPPCMPPSIVPRKNSLVFPIQHDQGVTLTFAPRKLDLPEPRKPLFGGRANERAHEGGGEPSEPTLKLWNFFDHPMTERALSQLRQQALETPHDPKLRQLIRRLHQTSTDTLRTMRRNTGTPPPPTTPAATGASAGPSYTYASGTSGTRGRAVAVATSPPSLPPPPTFRSPTRGAEGASEPKAKPTPKPKTTPKPNVKVEVKVEPSSSPDSAKPSATTPPATAKKPTTRTTATKRDRLTRALRYLDSETGYKAISVRREKEDKLKELVRLLELPASTSTTSKRAVKAAINAAINAIASP